MRALVLVALLVSCGGGVRFRPLALDVQGLSSSAESLTVLLFPAGDGPTCPDVRLDSVKGLVAPHTATWQRASGADRRFEFPSLEVSTVTAVAWSEDGQGMPIQFGCAVIDYLNIESPEAELRLSRRAS